MRPLQRKAVSGTHFLLLRETTSPYAGDSRTMTAKTNKQTGNPVVYVHPLSKVLFTDLAKLLVTMIP